MCLAFMKPKCSPPFRNKQNTEVRTDYKHVGQHWAGVKSDAFTFLVCVTHTQALNNII